MSKKMMIWLHIAGFALLGLIAVGSARYASSVADVQKMGSGVDTSVMYCVHDTSGSPWYCSSTPIVTK